MSSVEKVGTAELNDLIRLHLELKGQGRKLILLNTLDFPMQVFAMTRLDRLIEFRRDQPTASGMPTS
jgi:hypothetical protein